MPLRAAYTFYPCHTKVLKVKRKKNNQSIVVPISIYVIAFLQDFICLFMKPTVLSHVNQAFQFQTMEAECFP